MLLFFCAFESSIHRLSLFDTCEPVEGEREIKKRDKDEHREAPVKKREQKEERVGGKK